MPTYAKPSDVDAKARTFTSSVRGSPKLLRRSRRALPTILGMILALAAFEVALRPFARNLADLPAPMNGFRPSRDLSTPVRESRQFTEGVARAHFATDSARLTGYPPIEGAPVGLILGDSFVEAKQVGDSATLGAVVERLSRESGRPVNIRQYGWSGAGIPTYLAVADSMVKELRPEWVVIILNDDDLGPAALEGGAYWRMSVRPDSSYHLYEVERTAAKFEPLLGKLGLTSDDLRQAMNFSSLGFLCLQRLQLITGGGGSKAVGERTRPDAGRLRKGSEREAEDETAVRISVRALKSSYGGRLLIIYVPDVDLKATAEADEQEERLLRVCGEEGAACRSARETMLASRDVRQRPAQGFSNTVLGEGHLNEDGHRAVGEEIWRALSPPSEGGRLGNGFYYLGVR